MSETLAVFVWLTATLAHFLLSARFQRRSLQPLACFDDQAFATLVVGIGSLSVILHLVAMTAGLSLIAGLVALIVWHVGLWRISRSLPPTATAVDGGGVRSVAEWLALAIVTGILFTWVDVASESSAVTGTDAAHYHVPVAINLSLGSSLFDLPATPHPYPMAANLLHAWFILPLRDPVLVDLAMCLPFALLLAALNWMFRLCTGQSGLAWMTWIGLLLFSAPLVRSSSEPSADLWFASAFVALAAVLLAMWTRQASALRVMVLGSLSLGLLAGSKTMGSLAAVLLVVIYGLSEIGRLIVVRHRPRWSLSRALTTGAIAVILILGAGGIWLVRNWDLYGSPVAPVGLKIFGLEIFAGEAVEPTTHLSVFGDLQKDPSYDLVARTVHYMRALIGGWFVPALWLSVLLPIDLIVASIRRHDPSAVAARLLVWLMTVVSGAVMVWLLIGAPWTSLESFEGTSLRYLLPVIVLVPLVAFTALFPLSWRWYAVTETALLAQGALIAICLFAVHAALDPEAHRHINVPALSLSWLGIAGLVLLALQRMSAFPISATRMAGMLLIGLALAGTWSHRISRRAVDARYERASQEMQERSRFARLFRTGSDARDAYYLTLADEDAAGRQCEYRRFFVLTRFDEPLTLQSARYTNQVFHASREVERTRRKAPLGPCGYVVTTRPVMGTIKGTALVEALAAGSPVVEIGEAGPFVVLRQR